ncbi:MAG: agmatine deiminase [Actinomycetota bacterium]|nr:agmatine deiminase [Actinomycetota bacterium]
MSVLRKATMPAETAHHERTLMAWPTVAMAAIGLWGDAGLSGARAVYSEIARTIARYEPVTMVVAPEDAGAAEDELGPSVEMVALPIDDSWMRDTGPIVVVDADGSRRALHFRFNAWGEKWSPWDADAAVGASIAARLGLPVDEIPMVLEGGSIAVDGAGTVVTTERCLLNPNRNPLMSRAEIEHTLRAGLGVDRIVWLADAIAEDDGTDGHVDNVVAFPAPGHALLQGCAESDNPNRAIAIDNRHRLEAAGIVVTEIPTLPYAEFANGTRRIPVPYLNFYALNGAVVVPTVDNPADRDALAIIGEHYPGREIVAVPGAVLAHGGGGVHCITQQVPA